MGQAGGTSKAWGGPALGLAGVAVLAPQILGGATEFTALWVNLVACVSLLWTALHLRNRPGQLGSAPLAGIGALLVAGWTLVQALPLPCGWVGWAQQERAALLQEVAALSGLDAPRCGISAAPGSTWGALATATTLAALLLASAAIARRGGRSLMVQSIAVSSLVMTLVALGHWVLGAKHVFGLYDPVFANPRFLVAPLLNENHLAGHLALGFPVCLALAAAAEQKDATIAWLTASALVFTTGLLSLSRGGVIALVLAGAGFLASQLHGRRRRGPPLLLALAGIALGALGAFVAYDLLAKEFASEGMSAPSKLKLIADLLPLAAQHPIVGVGRGALGDMSPHVLLWNARALYVENLPVQWLVEWGAPATLLLFVCLGASAVRVRYRQARSVEVALACGIAALFVQNQVDFSLELPGVASTAAIAAGCLLSRERSPGTWASIPLRPLAIGAALCALLATGASIPWRSVWSKAELQASLALPRADAHEAIQRALRAYPLDPAFVVLAATQAARGERRDTGRWLNLAMRVAPGWAGPHLIAAEVLERRGAPQQAAIELSLAAGCQAYPASKLACELVQRHPTAEIAWSAADTTPARRQQSLEHLADCLSPAKHPLEMEIFAERLIDEYPKSLRGHSRLISAAHELGNQALALERARRLAQQMPRDANALAVLGEQLVGAGRAEEALGLVQTAPAELRAELRMLSVEASAAAALRMPERLDRVAEELLTRHGRTGETRAQIHRNLAARYVAMGSWVAAMKHARAAFDLTGTPADLEQVHALSLKAGIVAVTLRTASELCQLRHRGETYCGPQAGRNGNK